MSLLDKKSIETDIRGVRIVNGVYFKQLSFGSLCRLSNLETTQYLVILSGFLLVVNGNNKSSTFLTKNMPFDPKFQVKRLLMLFRGRNDLNLYIDILWLLHPKYVLTQ